ncbi:MAG: hypothetical protein ACRDJL_00895, partial [Actinomycetota bacterium]
MRRISVVALALMLFVPVPTATAQRWAPVEGGGSFTEAPLLEEGAYSDTIRLTEELFYAVELAQGQGLKVTAQILGQKAGPQDPALTGQLQIYSSLRD